MSSITFHACVLQVALSQVYNVNVILEQIKPVHSGKKIKMLNFMKMNKKWGNYLMWTIGFGELNIYENLICKCEIHSVTLIYGGYSFRDINLHWWFIVMVIYVIGDSFRGGNVSWWFQHTSCNKIMSYSPLDNSSPMASILSCLSLQAIAVGTPLKDRVDKNNLITYSFTFIMNR